MKKIIFLMSLLVMPWTVLAEDINNFDVKADVEIIDDSKVEGSNLLAGNIVESNGDVNGINISLANDYKFNGNADYNVSLSNNSVYTGTIENDAFIAGNIVKFDTAFSLGRDLNLAANSVELNGSYGRDIYIVANEVIINSQDIKGEVRLKASTIKIGPGVDISKLTYNEDAVIEIDSTAIIAETVLTEATFVEPTFADHVQSFIYGYANSLVTFLGLAFLLPALFKRIGQKYTELNFVNIFSTVGIGIISLLLIPMLLLLLLSLVFGISLGLILITAIVIGISMSTIFVGYLIGLAVYKIIFKKEPNTLLAGLIGISAIKLLALIPVINTVVIVFVVFLGFGIFIKLFMKN